MQVGNPLAVLKILAFQTSFSGYFRGICILARFLAEKLDLELTEELARKFSRIALDHVAREYPNKLDHVMISDKDAQPPRELHPVFFRQL